MRTATIILSGLALLAISVLIARRVGKPGGTTVEETTLGFITFWFLATATNLWAGVAKGGYTFREEMPIAALIFAIPAAAAALIRRRTG